MVVICFGVGKADASGLVVRFYFCWKGLTVMSPEEISMNSLTLASNVGRFLNQAVVRIGETAEVCGLLGGLFKEPDAALATVVHPLTNLSILNESFAIDPEELVQQRRSIEHAGLAALALYHSHSSGSVTPSFRDLELPSTTGLPSLIVARASGGMRWNCYDERNGEIMPIPVILPGASTVTTKSF